MDIVLCGWYRDNCRKKFLQFVFFILRCFTTTWWIGQYRNAILIIFLDQIVRTAGQDKVSECFWSWNKWTLFPFNRLTHQTFKTVFMFNYWNVARSINNLVPVTAFHRNLYQNTINQPKISLLLSLWALDNIYVQPVDIFCLVEKLLMLIRNAGDLVGWGNMTNSVWLHINSLRISVSVKIISTKN